MQILFYVPAVIKVDIELASVPLFTSSFVQIIYIPFCLLYSRINLIKLCFFIVPPNFRDLL